MGSHAAQSSQTVNVVIPRNDMMYSCMDRETDVVYALRGEKQPSVLHHIEALNHANPLIRSEKLTKRYVPVNTNSIML